MNTVHACVRVKTYRAGFLGCLLAALMAFHSGSAHGQSSKAQVAMDRGMKAGASGDLQSAIRHFEEALKHAPTNVFVCYNLGLAQAQAGNEFAAISWLEAYLAGSPDAPNADDVRQHIGRLEDRAARKIDTLFDKAADLCLELPAYTGPVRTKVARLAAESGNILKALEIAHKYGSKSDISRIWELYAGFLLDYGQLDEARLALRHVKFPIKDILFKDLDRTWIKLAREERDAGNYDLAEAAAQRIGNQNDKGDALRAIRVDRLFRSLNEGVEKGRLDQPSFNSLLSLEAGLPSWGNQIEGLFSFLLDQKQFDSARRLMPKMASPGPLLLQAAQRSVSKGIESPARNGLLDLVQSRLAEDRALIQKFGSWTNATYTDASYQHDAYSPLWNMTWALQTQWILGDAEAARTTAQTIWTISEKPSRSPLIIHLPAAVAAELLVPFKSRLDSRPDSRPDWQRGVRLIPAAKQMGKTRDCETACDFIIQFVAVKEPWDQFQSLVTKMEPMQIFDRDQIYSKGAVEFFRLGRGQESLAALQAVGKAARLPAMSSWKGAPGKPTSTFDSFFYSTSIALEYWKRSETEPGWYCSGEVLQGLNNAPDEVWRRALQTPAYRVALDKLESSMRRAMETKPDWSKRIFGADLKREQALAETIRFLERAGRPKLISALQTLRPEARIIDARPISSPKLVSDLITKAKQNSNYTYFVDPAKIVLAADNKETKSKVIERLAQVAGEQSATLNSRRLRSR